jgi:hypothetical protein
VIVALLPIIYRRKQRNVSPDAKSIPEMSAGYEHMVKPAYVASAHELSSANSGSYSTNSSAQRGVQYHEVEGQHTVRELP